MFPFQATLLAASASKPRADPGCGAALFTWRKKSSPGRLNKQQQRLEAPNWKAICFMLSSKYWKIKFLCPKLYCFAFRAGIEFHYTELEISSSLQQSNLFPWHKAGMGFGILWRQQESIFTHATCYSGVCPKSSWTLIAVKPKAAKAASSSYSF